MQSARPPTAFTSTGGPQSDWAAAGIACGHPQGAHANPEVARTVVARARCATTALMPCQEGRPLHTTSMRRASAMGTSSFMADKSTSRPTRAPASWQTLATACSTGIPREPEPSVAQLGKAAELETQRDCGLACGWVARRARCLLSPKCGNTPQAKAACREDA